MFIWLSHCIMRRGTWENHSRSMRLTALWVPTRTLQTFHGYPIHHHADGNVTAPRKKTRMTVLQNTSGWGNTRESGSGERWQQCYQITSEQDQIIDHPSPCIPFEVLCRPCASFFITPFCPSPYILPENDEHQFVCVCVCVGGGGGGGLAGTKILHHVRFTLAMFSTLFKQNMGVSFKGCNILMSDLEIMKWFHIQMPTVSFFFIWQLPSKITPIDQSLETDSEPVRSVTRRLA